MNTVKVPLEDLEQIIFTGANIRISTMALSVLSENKIGVVIIGQDYMPSSILLPYDANVRNAQTAMCQLTMNDEFKNLLWQKIIIRKIENQAKCLTLLGLEGAKELFELAEIVEPGDPENREGDAAKLYFQKYHQRLGWSDDDLINSCLSYIYAIIRKTIIRVLVCAGFYPALGIHHIGPFNSFNLADDLIEPWRAMVDLVAMQTFNTQTNLSREQRKNLTLTLHNACIINEEKNTIANGINILVLLNPTNKRGTKAEY